MTSEQARGKKVDKRADIWAFGVVAYEMLTGSRLFQGDDAVQVLSKVLEQTVDLEPVPPKFRRLIARCQDRNPKDRLRDIGEVHSLLQEASLPAALAVSSPAPASPRAAIAWSLCGLLAIGLATLAWIHFRGPVPAAQGEVRFQILPPERYNFSSTFVISPDGDKVVFGAADSSGQTSLWVRSLDSLEPRLLPGSEGNISHPFWSPDSRYVVFSADGKLKKIAWNANVAETICNVATDVVGGDWNRQGIIIFGLSDVPTPIMRVSASGGEPSPVTPKTQTGQTFATFLPDGRHFLYLRTAASPTDSGIFLASLDTAPDKQPSKRMLATPYPAAYVSHAGAGHLLFLNDTTLMAQRFDARKFELQGEAIPVADRLGVYRQFPGFSVSSTGQLVYRSGGTGLYGLTWYDRQGKNLGAVGPAGTYQMAALSPDGSRVAVMRIDAKTQNQDIFLFDLARGIPTRFTFDPGDDIDPVWSPDGRFVAFVSTRGGHRGIYKKLASGAGTEELLYQGPHLFLDDWSRDGRLLFSTENRETNRDLYTLAMDGSSQATPVLKSTFNETQGQFSPDGRWIAYSSDESGTREIYVQSFPESANGGKWQISNGGGAQPRWRRDGKELFFVANDRVMMAAGISTTPAFHASVPSQLFAMPINPGATNVFRWDVSADGQKFLVIASAQETAGSPLSMVLNWTAHLPK